MRDNSHENYRYRFPTFSSRFSKLVPGGEHENDDDFKPEPANTPPGKTTAFNLLNFLNVFFATLLGSYQIFFGQSRSGEPIFGGGSGWWYSRGLLWLLHRLAILLFASFASLSDISFFEFVTAVNAALLVVAFACFFSGRESEYEILTKEVLVWRRVSKALQTSQPPPCKRIQREQIKVEGESRLSPEAPNRSNNTVRVDVTDTTKFVEECKQQEQGDGGTTGRFEKFVPKRRWTRRQEAARSIVQAFSSDDISTSSGSCSREDFVGAGSLIPSGSKVFLVWNSPGSTRTTARRTPSAETKAKASKRDRRGFYAAAGALDGGFAECKRDANFHRHP